MAKNNNMSQKLRAYSIGAAVSQDLKKSPHLYRYTLCIDLFYIYIIIYDNVHTEKNRRKNT